jgi:predicted transcriptional regulator
MKAHHAFIRKVLLQKVMRKFAFCDISPVYRAPFDFVMNVPGDKRVIVGSVAASDERCLEKRVEEIVSVSDVIGARPVLITERLRFSSSDLSCICVDDLSAMRSPEDLVAIV